MAAVTTNGPGVCCAPRRRSSGTALADTPVGISQTRSWSGLASWLPGEQKAEPSEEESLAPAKGVSRWIGTSIWDAEVSKLSPFGTTPGRTRMAQNGRSS
ncbi:hypothetical protein UY3_15351 [Chelonia mydas]|uniref:Uncharacterized protein n=1 Tax=Chelonia mydas TaxID=8469 RepID=M7BH50_CHEMY|nr:hypothetical protein UY3_15351 [Chelonia mydas]